MRNHVVIRDITGVPRLMVTFTGQDVLVDESDTAFEMINVTTRSVEVFPRSDAYHTAETYTTASSTGPTGSPSHATPSGSVNSRLACRRGSSPVTHHQKGGEAATQATARAAHVGTQHND